MAHCAFGSCIWRLGLEIKTRKLSHVMAIIRYLIDEIVQEEVVDRKVGRKKSLYLSMDGGRKAM